MIRLLHRWPGLVLAALVLVSSLSGAALALFPAMEAVQAPRADASLTVAELAVRVQATHPGLEQIKRSPSGQFSAWWFDGAQPGSAIVDPATGRDIARADPDPVRRWLTTFHRSLFLGDGGRLMAAVSALAMLVLALTGVLLVARRTGGWRGWFTRLRGPLAGRWHTELSRIAVFGLLLSSVTALWMSAETFDLVAHDAVSIQRPQHTSVLPGRALANMDALRVVPAYELRALSFPAANDPQDVFTLETSQGMGYVDPGTGTLLAWQGASGGQRFSETIHWLHTGQGAAILGIILGLTALCVPFMVVTGVLVWSSGRRGRPRLKDNASANEAETVILVGSEGGSTWGFAFALASALRQASQSVHVAPMSGFVPSRYRRAERFLILAATYGQGDAPASAKGFLDNLQALPSVPRAPLAVLGFGDHSFPEFCAFAKAVDTCARHKGWPVLLPFDTIDRQSSQDFTRWGHALGDVLGLPLELEHLPVPPDAVALTLLERSDYGAAVQVPMAILRFAVPRAPLSQRLTGQGFVRFEAGDLLGILPEGSAVPRLYSLASGSDDGFIEIVVRKHPGGLSSSQLTALEPGQSVPGFLRRNPGFHAGCASTPLILIGAGTGVGPLIGFIRANAAHRPMHLFFGLRNPDSDFLYHEELLKWQSTGRLGSLTIAASRGKRPQYVQDVLRDKAPQVVDAVRQGATIMVCGGRDMARGVQEALTAILQPIGLTPAQLKDNDRYHEDVY
jgi:sulfite reductase (NADPH) flavoprotein alpha-component